MKWTKIDESNLPDREVLAANFEPGTSGYREKIIGFLFDEEEGSLVCENEYEQLQSCTHYIDIHKYDVNPEA